MITARDLARRLRIADTSVVQSIQGLCELEFTDDQHLEMIAELRGIDHKLDAFTEKHVTKYAFRFFYQELLTQEIKGLPQNPDSVYLNALIKARNYINEHSYVFATAVEDEPKLDSNGNVAPKKGDKKVIAKSVYEKNKDNKALTRKDWIALLVKEVGLTDAGASTYYANLKAGKF